MIIDFREFPIVGYWIKWLQDEGFDYGTGLVILWGLLFVVGVGNTTIEYTQVFSLFFATSPIWLPLILFLILFFKWGDFVGKKFYLISGRTTLRIKLPQEIMKSPEAMEFVLTQINNKYTPDNFWETYIDGKRPLPMSLELVSIGGDVRFYVNLPSRRIKDIFETQMYAQYPGVEIIEEPVDYASEFPLDGEGYRLLSLHIGKKKDEEFPIKTYIDFKLDKMPKEEEKSDPVTTILEYLGTMTQHERLYIQMICVPFRSPSFKKGQLIFGEGETWNKRAHRKIDEILHRDPDTKSPLKGSEGPTDAGGDPRISPGERDKVEAIERNASKWAFNVGIRFIYLAKDGHYNNNRLGSTLRIFSQFDFVDRNELGMRWRTDFNYRWLSDPFGDRIKAYKRQEFKEFKLRKYFLKSFHSDGPKIFTVEELATMFHIPGKVALTPTLGRIPSTRSEAPSNLPIGDLPSTNA